MLSAPEEVANSDRILFEYALNDQIFESSNTLDAQSHLLTLRALVAEPAIAARLVFVLMVGQGPAGRAASDHSFVLDNYRKVAEECGVPVIDLIPHILASAANVGVGGVFKDSDHFTESMVGSLVEVTSAALASLPPLGAIVGVPAGAPCLVRLDPVLACSAERMEMEVFHSQLLTSEMALLGERNAIELVSPGGLLMGCYARCSSDAGMLRLTVGERDVLKSMRHCFPYAKPFVALRHLSSPVPTRPGDRIVLRRVEGLADAPDAQLDATLAQVANQLGGDLAIGSLLFLQADPMSLPTAGASAMAATLRHLHSSPTDFDIGRTVGRQERAPDETGHRVAEGGLRLQGRYKRSLPGLPLVSIVTVSLNAARTIGQTIASVLCQTYANIEYIVVDGASTDGTLDVIRAYQQAIDYFVSEPDAGLYAAMNKAIGLAGGDFVLVLNADDRYAEDAVEALVNARAYSGCDIVSALAQYVDADGRPVQVMRSMPFDAGLRLRMALRHETMLIPASVYERFGGYDETYRVIADFDFTRRLFEAGLSHYEVPRALLFFRNTGVSSTALDKLASDRALLLCRQFPELPQEDIDLLATMSNLRPDLVEPLARRHPGSGRLVEALRAYQTDQAGRPDAPAWKRYVVDWGAIDRRLGRPKVSVILPVYNAADTLPAALDSVLTQTLAELEVICLNDATPDGSQSIIDDYVRRDPRVRSLINDRNMGLGATRNRGVSASRGAYVFHLDPDDTLPPRALERLYEAAEKHGSDMVKGDYLREQTLHGKARGEGDRFSLLTEGRPIVNTTLQETPHLLRTTEGHWSYLYRAGFARQVPYPTDLKMGQDSIFLVNALVRARAVSLVPEVVYHYRANPSSAMNTFTFRKFADGLEWRRRAWHVLRDHALPMIADRLLLSYWSDAFFTDLGSTASREQLKIFLGALLEALRQAGARAAGEGASPLVKSLFARVLAGDEESALALLHRSDAAAKPARASIPVPRGDTLAPGQQPDRPQVATQRPLRVATFCSTDQGGAAIGSHRRIEALRRRGVDVTLHSLVTKSGRDYVRRIEALEDGIVARNGDEVWEEVSRRAILPVVNLEGYRAQEMFSLAQSVVDFRKLKPLLDEVDVVHFHWVVGMMDLEHVECLADKPMVWTLADMNAFTGGCHYSEGCQAYREDCRECVLLGGRSDLAHESWARKKAAYQRLRRLHIVCPSQWIADQVARSSLLGDKPIHVIPNAFPVDRLVPTNKTAARIKLGLPLNKKLILFGAVTVTNMRKGSAWLGRALDTIARRREDRIEVVLFGNGTIDLPLPVHRLGHVASEERLALAYSAADAFVFPSEEDNAPLTVGESLLCGTPVVAFPVGNVPELLHHLDTGYIAQDRDADDLVRGIDWALEADPTSALRRSLRCRLSAAAFHDPLVAADRHLEVYNEAMRDA